MSKKPETKTKRDKVRIPVPQKPPKAEESPKSYNRRKVNKETKDIISETDKNSSRNKGIK
jgi:hypothetical protein